MIFFNKKRYILVFLIFTFIAFFTCWSKLPDDKFHIYFFDVGQGDCIFIKTPLNHKILIDGGPFNSVLDNLGEVLPFFDSKIDLIILTHPHSDHIDGLFEVLKKYQVAHVLFTGVLSDEEVYLEFLKHIINFNIPVTFADYQNDFLFGDVLFDVVYPISPFFEQSFENLNNSSIVLKILYRDHSILLMGDCEIECEQELIDFNLILDSDILKVGHHGSKTASSLDFLYKVSAEIAVIQSSSDNKWGHPHFEVLENLKTSGVKQIYRNDLNGTVEFIF
jgi:competence protein ComEC